MAIKWKWIPRAARPWMAGSGWFPWMGCRTKTQKGFAIIFVLSFVAVLLTVVGDVVYQTQIVAKHTMASQDQLQAQGTALTGMSIGRVLMKFHILATSPEYASLPVSLPTSLYSALNGFPIGKDAFDDNASLSEVIDEKLFNTLKKIPGHFVLNINAENCKFNLNLLQKVGMSESGEMALRNLMTTEDAQLLLGIYKLNGNALVDNLKEYFTKIKRPLLSVQELRMVEGFQYDDIYNIYAPYFTVWPKDIASLMNLEAKPLNFNCAPIELLASIFREPGQSISPVVWKKFYELRSDGTYYKKFFDLNDKWLKNLTVWNTGNTHKLLQDLAGFDNSVFRIESKGSVNKTEQKLVVVLHVSKETNETNPNPEKSAQFVVDYSQWNPLP